MDRAERNKRSRSAKEERKRGAPLTNLWPTSQASSTMSLANLLLESQTNLITLLARLWQYAKGVSNDHLWCPKQRRSQVSKNGLYCLWSGWQRCIQRRYLSLMSVKDRQKRANVAFKKPLTTHLTHGKDNFSVPRFPHTSSPKMAKNHEISVYFSTHAPVVEGGGILNKIWYGEGTPQKSNFLTFYIPFWQKRYTFYIPFIEKRYPFHQPTLGSLFLIFM